MKAPRLLCFFLLLVYGVLSAAAQDDLTEVFNFPLSRENLARYNAICAILAEHPVVAGIFTQTRTLSRQGRSLVSRGNFIIAAKLGMVWDTQAPFPSTMAVGRDYIIQSTPRGTRTRLEARGNETFLRLSDTISAVFSGDARKLRENFENYFVESGGNWILGLVPTDRAIRNFAARIIMSGDSVIRIIILREQNGDTIRYELADHDFPGALSPHEEALFSLD
ncbi:MAG: outer membrane lipoprotein carrier protein LolA [Spirochaetaceae bacterium]|jgi:hypothetical protein|nr:outer membrane lipoprotein carrier protein LolA [Spirochaetaceae bacterium]